MLFVPLGERVYGEFGVFHIVHVVACCQLWVVICLYWVSCDAQTLHLKSCLESDSPIVSAVAHYGVHYGRMNSHIGWNAFFCCSRYDVADILCVTRCMVSRYVDEYISPHLRASVLLLLELLFITDGSFSCSLLSSHDTDELVDVICTSWCK